MFIKNFLFKKKLVWLYNLIMTELGPKKNLPFVENIFNGEKLLAIVLRTEFKTDGIKFFTPDDFSQLLVF